MNHLFIVYLSIQQLIIYRQRKHLEIAPSHIRNDTFVVGVHRNS